MTAPSLAPQRDRPPQEGAVILRGLLWEQFKAIEANLAGIAGIRLTYCDRTLVIMSPISYEHELPKKRLSSLLEIYLDLATDIEYFPCGSMTVAKSGIAQTEPDESYCFGQRKPIPDLAIEIAITSGGIEKLKAYQQLGVAEVWFWQKDQLNLYCLDGEEYRNCDRSRLLPDLDLALISRYMAYSSHRQAMQEYRAVINQV